MAQKVENLKRPIGVSEIERVGKDLPFLQILAQMDLQVQCARFSRVISLLTQVIRENRKGEKAA